MEKLLIVLSNALRKDLRKSIQNQYHLITTRFDLPTIKSVIVESKPQLVLMIIENEKINQVLELAKLLDEKYFVPHIFLTKKLPDQHKTLLLESQPLVLLEESIHPEVLMMNIENAVRIHTQLFYVKHPFQQFADFANDQEKLKTQSSSGGNQQEEETIDEDKRSRIEIVNNRFMKQYWILEEAG
ncbi:MAG: hypothetical protein ACOC4J_02350 [Bacteroidota bacterium]